MVGHGGTFKTFEQVMPRCLKLYCVPTLSIPLLTSRDFAATAHLICAPGMIREWIFVTHEADGPNKGNKIMRVYYRKKGNNVAD